MSLRCSNGSIIRSHGECVHLRKNVPPLLRWWTQLPIRRVVTPFSTFSSSVESDATAPVRSRGIFPPWMKLTDLSSTTSSSSLSMEMKEEKDSYSISIQSAETLLASIDHISNRHFQKAAGRILRVLLKKQALNAESMRVCYEIMDACIRKYKRVENQATTFWMCNDRLFWNAFLHLWRDQIVTASKTKRKNNQHSSNNKNNNPEIDALELTQQLLTWSRLIPSLPYGNARTLGILVQVAMIQQSPEQAPIVIEEIIQQFRNEYTPDIIPMNEYLYLQLLTAWTRSGRRTEEIPTKIQQIVSAMQQTDKPQNNRLWSNKQMSISYYHLLLQYWGKVVGDMGTCETLLEEMKRQSLPITRTTLAPFVSAFCRAKQVHRAEQIIDQMMLLPSSSTTRQQEAKETKNNDNHHHQYEVDNNQYTQEDLVLSNCTREILLYYRDEIKNEFTSDIAQVRFLQAAEQLYHRMVKVLPPWNSGKLGTTLIEIYAILGKHDEVAKFKSIIEKHSKFPAAKVHFHSSLFKALGNKRQPEQATDMLIEALQSTRDVKVDLGLLSFNTLINSWAESTHPHKFSKAFAVFRLLDNDPKCLEADIRPDVYTFSVLLKCLRKSQEPEPTKRAIEILDEMERRYRDGHNTRPDIVCYALAIRIFLSNHDLEGASATMDRMEAFGIAPTLRIYNIILSFWSNMASHAAAERAEEVLMRINQAAAHDTDLTPDVYSYSFVLNAWAKAKTAISADRMWYIYDQNMRANNIQPNMAILTTMINFFAKTGERTSIRRADMIIEEMETKYRSWSVTPDHRHYIPVFNAWIAIGEGSSAVNLFRRQVDAYLFDPARVELAPRATKIHDAVYCLIQQDEEGGYLTEAYDFLRDMHFLANGNEIPNFPHDRTYSALYKALEASRIFKRSTLMREVKSKFNENADKDTKEFDETSDEDDLDGSNHGDDMKDSGNSHNQAF